MICFGETTASEDTYLIVKKGADLFKSHHPKLLIGFLLFAIVGSPSTYSSAAPLTPKVLWGNAMEGKGLPKHNYLFGSDLFSVSCASAGNCSAGGSYALSAKISQAFVVEETNGVWGRAQAVPGLTRHDASENTQVTVMSCPSSGNCGAAGIYSVKDNRSLIFVLNEKNGAWGHAIEVPGSARLDGGGGGFITSISCPSAGNCDAGGILPVKDSTANSGAFVVDETKGVWGKALELSGPAWFNHNSTGIDSLSCASVGNCSAGGAFPQGAHGGGPSFVVDETDGTWGKAHEILGFPKLSLGGSLEFRSISCGAPGTCSAVGQYQQKNGDTWAYIVSEEKGTWGTAFRVPGLSKLNDQHLSSLTTISCVSGGNCTAGGYHGNGDHQVAFIVSEEDGTWGTATAIPGLTALNTGHTSYMQTISCVSIGNCGASGTYTGAPDNAQSFLANETNGTWGPATAIRGLAKLKAKSSYVNSLSCASPVSCSAVGGFSASGNNGTLIVSTEPHK
jgi:hypothetical protein